MSAIPVLPHSWVELIGLAIIIAFQVWQTMQNKGLHNQLNSLLDKRVAAAN